MLYLRRLLPAHRTMHYPTSQRLSVNWPIVSTIPGNCQFRPESENRISLTDLTPVNSSHLTQCLLNFRDHPDAFSDDSAKVTYVLSFLHGTALNWFEPTLTSGRYAPWLTDYSAFVSELRNNFGPHDLEGEAEVGLENLQMCDTQRITKYLV